MGAMGARVGRVGSAGTSGTQSLLHPLPYSQQPQVGKIQSVSLVHKEPQNKLAIVKSAGHTSLSTSTNSILCSASSLAGAAIVVMVTVANTAKDRATVKVFMVSVVVGA